MMIDLLLVTIAKAFLALSLVLLCFIALVGTMFAVYILGREIMKDYNDKANKNRT